MAKRLVVFLLVAFVLLAVLPVGGVAQERKVTADPLLFGVASFVLPGLGQYLNGESGKALAHLLIAAAIPLVCNLITYFAFPFDYYPRYSLCALAYLGWAAYSAMDAYQTAKRRGGTLPFTP